MASIFSKIIQKEIPAEIISENDQFIAFLDIMPLVHGHTLVVPKQEVDYIFDLSTEDLAGLLEFARPIAKAIEKQSDGKKKEKYIKEYNILQSQKTTVRFKHRSIRLYSVTTGYQSKYDLERGLLKIEIDPRI